MWQQTDSPTVKGGAAPSTRQRKGGHKSSQRASGWAQQEDRYYFSGKGWKGWNSWHDWEAVAAAELLAYPPRRKAWMPVAKGYGGKAGGKGSGTAKASSKSWSKGCGRGRGNRTPANGKASADSDETNSDDSDSRENDANRRRRRKRNRKPRVRRSKTPDPQPPLAEQPLLYGDDEGPIGDLLTRNNFRGDLEIKLHDEFRRSFVCLIRKPFANEKLDRWLEMCSGIDWTRPLTRRRNVKEDLRPMPRDACWFTASGCDCTYEYASTSFPSTPMPQWLLEITDEVCQVCGITERPNSCNANRYENGNDAVGWHADDEDMFDAKNQDALIISLSLGAKRTFELRPGDQPKEITSMLLGHGDICTMEGLCQKHYKHCVPVETEVEQPRINLTWRWIVRHQPGCQRATPLENVEDNHAIEKSERSALCVCK